MNRRPGSRGLDRAGWCRAMDSTFRAGSHDRLIEELLPEIRATAARIRGLTPEQREDVVSETTLHLLNEWARGKTYGGAPIVAVARQRTKYIARDLFQGMSEPRRHGFKVVPLDYGFPTHGGDGDSEGARTDAPDPSPGPEALAIDRDVASRALASLPPRERDVVRMRCLEGMASYEVAEHLECEPNAVDQAFHRAKRRLRESGFSC